MATQNNKKNTVSLEDKYTLEEGRIFVSGSQALARLPMLQKQLDKRNGLNTAGFISGYRGSPLAGVDRQLWGAGKYLKEHNIEFTPSVNEDLGATAVWGSQQTHLFPDATVDGVFALWYGKNPGVDRSMDAFRHANAAGTSATGGVVALLGDDHDCVSSTIASQSEQDMISAMVPVLYPATVQEYLDFGLMGFAMSRYTGAWVGLKCVTEIVESSASIEVSPNRIKIKEPTKDNRPEGGLNIRMPDPPLEQEKRLEFKLEAALAFAKANQIDNTIINPKKAKLGIITSGKSFKDVMQALEDLGLDKKAAEKLGIRVYKVGMVWPLEPTGAQKFAEGVDEVLVVEEKREMLEQQLKELLYGQNNPPRIVGKKDENGKSLLPFAGGHTPGMVAMAVAGRIVKNCGSSKPVKTVQARAAAIKKQEDAARKQTDNIVRLPYYCAGCPHNSSTQVPEGSRAIAGIGCHYMVQWMNRNSNIITHMGGEGVNWVGHAPFTKEEHVFANLGDGTYYHSGILAIRQAVAAGVNITYKILFNDAVAMTGGQAVDGPLSVPQITHQMAAEQVNKIYVLSNEPEKYTDKSVFAKGTVLKHRDDLDDVQHDLRQTKGTTVLIYDQTCAAELRRRRKRGKAADPAKRTIINPLVCEGCGDCSDKSNCVAVEPLETEFGRKRKINQSSCNKDFSCQKGFCPSFVTIEGGELRKHKPRTPLEDAFAKMPDPKLPKLEDPYSVLVTGIGGTGVITIGAILGMAAHIEEKGVTVLDQTGLAQKNGAVMSHVRIGKSPESLHASRIATGSADLLIGADMVVSASSVARSRLGKGRTKGIVNTHLTPTADFTLRPDVDFRETDMMVKIKEALGEENTYLMEGTHIAETLMGDAIATNMFMLGYAYQHGFVPLSHKSIEQALNLNGVAVQDNIKSFNLGRLSVHNPDEIKKMLKEHAEQEVEKPSETLDDLIAKRMAFLTDYQNAKYAEKYKELVTLAQQAEQKAVPNSEAFTEAVARYGFKLMAYKDEYEVARLFTNGAFKQQLKHNFTGNYKIKFHMAPPLLSRKNRHGELQKMAFNRWMYGAFAVLKHFKFLRGTPFDFMGWSAERRTERQLVRDYFTLIEKLTSGLSKSNHELCVALARVPEEIRGFGHVKERHLEAARLKWASLEESFDNKEKVAIGTLPGPHLPTSEFNNQNKEKVKVAIA